MSVKRIITGYHFNCISSDVKPSGVPEGSTVKYIDTGEKFFYSDDMWELESLGD